MKIAVIGGSGFIGTRLCQRLAKSGEAEFVILDKVKSKAFPDAWLYCDVEDVDTIKKCLSQDIDVVVNLAAEHQDNIQPKSRYFDVNVQGQKNVCSVMDEYSIKRHVFTSSVAIYGFVDCEVDESAEINPFHEYGESKWQAEQALNQWSSNGSDKENYIIRPTVVFGEKNRGNVYNLLKQIASGRFFMIGKGDNKKSMAYVENVAQFLEFLTFNPDSKLRGNEVFNYVDKPDLNMNDLCALINNELGRSGRVLRIPFVVGLLAGYGFDLLSLLLRRKFPVSAIRIRKFCATTQFGSKNIKKTGFTPEVSLQSGIRRTISHEFGAK